MAEREALFDNPYTDRVLTQLQETGHVWLTEARLSDLVGLVQALGIDLREVVVSRGGARQIHLEIQRD